MNRIEIIRFIETQAARHNWRPATFTSRAVGNSRLYARMKAGGACSIETAERLLKFDPHAVQDEPPDAKEVSE